MQINSLHMESIQGSLSTWKILKNDSMALKIVEFMILNKNPEKMVWNLEKLSRDQEPKFLLLVLEMKQCETFNYWNRLERKFS